LSVLERLPEPSSAGIHVQFQIYRKRYTWKEVFNDAAAFASALGPERAVNISHSSDGVVTVWYRDAPSEGMATLEYRSFSGALSKWEVLFQQATDFVATLEEDQLLSVSHSSTMVTVWFWAREISEEKARLAGAISVSGGPE